MEFFTIITGATALIHTGGVYRQADLYARGEAVYAKYGAGFVKLSTGGATSKPNMRWAQYDAGEAAIITEDKPGFSAPKYEGQRDTANLEAAE